MGHVFIVHSEFLVILGLNKHGSLILFRNYQLFLAFVVVSASSSLTLVHAVWQLEFVDLGRFIHIKFHKVNLWHFMVFLEEEGFASHVPVAYRLHQRLFKDDLPSQSPDLEQERSILINLQNFLVLDAY